MDVGAPKVEALGVKSVVSISILFGLSLSITSCVGKMKYEKVDELKRIEEFDNRVKIDLGDDDKAEHNASAAPGAPVAAAPVVPTTPVVVTPPETKKVESPKPEPKGKKNRKKSSKKGTEETPPKIAEVAAPGKKLPDIEDAEGFIGRRPIKDPYRVGERVYHDVTYYGVSAGSLEMEVKPYAMVNGRKSYNFRFAIKSSSLFSSFYFVDDFVNTLVDFESLVPSVYTLHVKESRQLRETRMLFAHENGKDLAHFWEKKVTERDGEEQRKITWEIAEYSQNVFSAIFYMRAFQWKDGVEYAFRVADSEENHVFKGKVIRREKLSTAAGDFNAIVVKPEVELKGKLKPVGENLVWLSDDDRKFILRIESKIKIGSLVSEISQLDKGRE